MCICEIYTYLSCEQSAFVFSHSGLSINMSRLLEHDAKRILADAGLAVPSGVVVDDSASDLNELTGPLVVKALVPASRKALGGGVRFAQDAQEAREHVRALLGSSVNGYLVHRELVEHHVSIARELFLSIEYDSIARAARLTIGNVGGIHIESALRDRQTASEPFHHIAIDPRGELCGDRVATKWRSLGFDRLESERLTAAAAAAWKAFAAVDATLIELNPLAISTDGAIWVLGALMSIDDDALFRHPELSGVVEPGNDRSWREMTLREQRALAVDASDPYRGTVRYTEMADGDIGVCGVGGGGSLVTFDLLERYGLKPANYAECGGNPSEAKVYGLMSVILSRPGVRALFVNAPITNNTRTDQVALGIVRAVRECGLSPDLFPIVVRMAGLNDLEAQRVFAADGITCWSEDVSMEDAVALLVQRLDAPAPSLATS
jgi:succinyl-CoA synthetase beta subunit